jgi:hypothetical protein
MNELDDVDLDQFKSIAVSLIQKWLYSLIHNNLLRILNLIQKYTKTAKIPALFLDNPELYNGFKSFCIDIHDQLSLKMIQSYILLTRFPALVNAIKKNSNSSQCHN